MKIAVIGAGAVGGYAPGVIRHIEGDRLPVGELDGSASERVGRVSSAFAAAGFRAPVLADIRAEIWLKLWANLSFNPISALTGSDRQESGRTADQAMGALAP